MPLLKHFIICFNCAVICSCFISRSDGLWVFQRLVHTDIFILLCFILLPQNCLETFGKMLSCQDLDEKIDTTLMLAVAVNTQL